MKNKQIKQNDTFQSFLLYLKEFLLIMTFIYIIIIQYIEQYYYLLADHLNCSFIMYVILEYKR